MIRGGYQQVLCGICWWNVLLYRRAVKAARREPATWRKRKVWLAEERMVQHHNRHLFK